MARRPSERRREPAPLLRNRIASGRGAMEQPNATGDGDVPLTARFWAAVVLTGIAAGFVGVALMLVLYSVQGLAFGAGTPTSDVEAAVAAADPLHRVLPLLAAGVIAGVGWYVLRRVTAGKASEVDDAIWRGDGTLSVARSTGTSVLSVIVVGLGASLGREAAPKLMGGVCGSILAGPLGLSAAQRRLLVACGAGAGVAAVYNVPLAGALFTAEVLCGTVRLPVILPALASSATATLVGWIYLPTGPVYPGIPSYPFHLSEIVWALLAGPLIGLAAVGFVRLVAWVSHRRPRGRWELVAPLGAFAVLAALGLLWPQLYGNGQGMARDAFLGVGGIGLFTILMVLKPLVTTLCLGSGAAGGLLTPTLSTGAVLGGFLGSAWALLWPGAPVGAFAMMGAAAMLGAGMQAPLAALALVLELTHSGFELMVPAAAVTLIATAVARWVDGYSIYSARLSEVPSPH
ncbi:chloride channel protein [Pseudonocardia sulfidoxydans NBRC 16205]|uniref:Chloride channel protein n=1 Tax=Pseudonocardia sulfidoxydans NBRC 16205 TaxID=1223511 RepID=A0A511DDI2_9PSEU|nr:chloride channel protein [Pseudonocardia sulfidoxydans]GEL22870.1 chloride channel protein [Pseudonocardia sulfidoxydans NBRC 16205]